MINGYYDSEIKSEIKHKIGLYNSIELWVCCFEIDFSDPNCIVDLKVPPMKISIARKLNENRFIYFDDNEEANILILNNKYYLSTDEDNCVNEYNRKVYNVTTRLVSEIESLDNSKTILSEYLKIIKDDFVDTDYVMERLTR